jgi:O-antigen/teichoic acid export membrane protein
MASNAGFFVAVLILARSLGPAQRGSFAFVSVVGLLIGSVAALGLGSALAVIAAREPARRPELVTTGLAWGALTGAVAGGLLVTIGAIIGTDALPAGVDLGVLCWIAVAAVSMSAMKVVFAVHQGSGLFRALAVVTAAAPWIYCAILAVAALTDSLDFTVAVEAWVVYWLVWSIGIGLMARSLIGFGRIRVATITESLTFGLRAWVGSLSTTFNDRADQVLMGFIATETSLGLYAVAVNFGEVLLYIPAVVGFALLPTIARSPQHGRTPTTLSISRRITVVTATTALVAAAAGPLLLPLVFGAAYDDSVTPFLLLIPGAFGFAFLSIFSSALVASGAPGLSSSGPLAALSLGVALDLLLIPPFGANGAAIAASTAFLAGGAVVVAGYRRVDRFPLRDLLPRAADVVALRQTGRQVLSRKGVA